MKKLRYGSVCSGIEAATVAWHTLGWEPAFFSEIEPFPSAVLAHHYPDVPNYGDMTRFEEWPDEPIDLLVGGTPCQSFSVAGLRQGLADPRGNLMLTYLAIARRYRPRWLVWENVPGVLSSGEGRDFGTFLRGLEECGYHAAWRVLDAQYVRVDGYERAVPQRRRRVFVVGYLGDWRRAAAVLFERESMSGNPAPRREAGEGIAPTISARATGGGGLGTDFDCDGGLITFDRQSSGEYGNEPIASTDSARDYKSPSDLVAYGISTQQEPKWGEDVSPTLALPSKSGGGQVTAVAHPYTLAIRGRDGQPDLEYRRDGTANAVLTPNGGRAGIGVGAIAFDTTQITSKDNYSRPRAGDPCHPLAAGAHAPAVAFDWYASQSQSLPIYEGLAPPLKTTMQPAVHSGWAVRRLTPRECERLQGFPDDFTAIPYRNKIAADGPRYKALGNSMAVNVMRWIGQRIDHVERLTAEIGREAA